MTKTWGLSTWSSKPEAIPKQPLSFTFPLRLECRGPEKGAAESPPWTLYRTPSLAKLSSVGLSSLSRSGYFLFIIIKSYIFSYELKLLHSTRDTSSNYPTAIHNHLYDVIDDLVTNPTQSNTNPDEIDISSNSIVFTTNNLIFTDGHWPLILFSTTFTWFLLINQYLYYHLCPT